MLFGFNAVTERNKTKKTRLCKVQNENGGSFEVLSDETELRHTERCCRINHRYVSKKCGMNGYKI